MITVVKLFWYSLELASGKAEENLAKIKLTS